MSSATLYLTRSVLVWPDRRPRNGRGRGPTGSSDRRPFRPSYAGAACSASRRGSQADGVRPGRALSTSGGGARAGDSLAAARSALAQRRSFVKPMRSIAWFDVLRSAARLPRPAGMRKGASIERWRRISRARSSPTNQPTGTTRRTARASAGPKPRARARLGSRIPYKRASLSPAARLRQASRPADLRPLRKRQIYSEQKRHRHR